MGRQILRRNCGTTHVPKAFFMMVLLTAVLTSLLVMGTSPDAWSADSALIHNSNRFGICKDSGGVEIPALSGTSAAECTATPGNTWTPTTKWGGSWGIPAGQYDEFVCETCHEHGSDNIKNVKKVITSPNDPTHQFPGSSVNFLSTFDFGDDTGGHATSSKVCEVCHSTTLYHRYNTSGQTVLDHYNNADCVTCHKHNVGFKPLDCDACHGYPPTDLTLTSLNGKTTGSTTSGKHVTHATTLGYTCENCHNNSVMPQESTVKPGFWDISIAFNNYGSTTGTYSGQTNISYNDTLGTGGLTCSTVYCHGTTLDGANKTPVWTGSVACGDCHKASAANPPSLGNHARHAGNGAGQLNLACTDCHGANGAGGNGHVSGTIQWSLNTGNSKFGASAKYNGAASGATTNRAPSGTYQSCSTVYCHSNAQGAGGIGAPSSYSSPTWGGGAISCGGCHADMAGVSGTGSHITHANGYTMACANCHTGYTASSTNSAQHVNVNVDVAISATYGGTYTGTGTPGDGYGTCSTNYCHSSGQATPSYVTPTWGTASSGACGTCHGADAATAPASASHAKHVGSSSAYKFSCQKCHSVTVDGTATDSTTKPGIASKTAHVNMTRDVDLNTADPLVGSSAADDGAGTCSNVYCHSTGKAGIVPAAQLPPAYSGTHYSSVTWNGPALTCASCHGKTDTEGTYIGYPDYTMADQNADKGTARANSHQSQSHNQTSCSVCHNSTTTDGLTIASSTHVNAAINVNFDPAYNLGGTATYNPDRSCSNVSCHGVQSAVWGAIGSCTDCHEAGAVNISGVHSRHWETAAGNASARATGNASTQTYYQFQCDTCHTGGAHPDGVIGQNFADVGFNITWAPVGLETIGVYAANTGNGNDTVDSRLQKISTDGSCSSIYCHSSGIAPGAAGPTYADISWNTTPQVPDCGVCHGAPPSTNVHTVHAGTYSLGCVECHQATVSDSTTIADKTKHVNAINDVAWKTGGFNIDGSNYEAGGADTCSNIYCHSAGTNSAAPYSAPNTTPVWTASTTTECVSCHNGDAASTGGGMNTNRHAAHVSNQAVNGVNYSCDICHSATASGNRTISTPANHVNKLVNVAFTALNTGSTYTGTTTPGDAVGNCNNLYCHSNGKTGTGVLAYTNPTWNGAAIGCNGCHGTSTSSGYPDYASGAAGSATANGHAKHAGTMGYNCSACHNSVTTNGTAINGASPALHINADPQNVDFAADLGGSYTAGAKTCSTNYCHSSIQGAGGIGAPATYASPQWGAVGPLGCAACHVNMATDAIGTGSHKLHAGTTGNAQYDCAICHGTGYSASTVVNGTHANKIINMSFTGNATGTTYSDGSGPAGNGYGTCTTSNCHGNGTQTWGQNTATTTCEKCHGSAATAATGSFKDTSGSTAGSKVGSHVSHLASSHNWTNDIACDQCHAIPGSVNAAGHFDTALPAELTWGTLATKGGTLSPNYAASTCSTVYCHGEGISGGTNKTPTWGDLAYLSGTTAQKCGTCHGYPPPFPHTTNTNCYTCHDHVNVTNNGFVDITKHVNMVVDVSADACLDCHSGLSDHHLKHTDTTILTGKSLSNGDWEGSWVYSTTYSPDGMPKFACGICHAATLSTHRNGIVDLDLDPSHTSDPSSIKTKNRVDAFYTRTTGVSVTCNGVYCHSNGLAPYTFTTTPDWYVNGPWASVDKCAQCHGNSPSTGGKTGSSAHGVHVVGIHYKDIFSGTSGKMTQGGATGAVHGNPNSASTINCNICHNNTVTVSYNDKNTVCVTCHDGATAPTKGAMDIAAGSTSHINGQVDVAFGTFSLKSRAQLRDDISTKLELNNAWTRNNGYKASTSYDASKRQPTYDLGTCSSVDCHNGTPMQWNAAGPLSCNACHKALPQ